MELKIPTYNEFIESYAENIIVNYIHTAMDRSNRKVSLQPENMGGTIGSFGIIKKKYKDMSFEEYLEFDSKMCNQSPLGKKILYYIQEKELIQTRKYMLGYLWNIYTQKVMPRKLFKTNIYAEVFIINKGYVLYSYYLFNNIHADVFAVRPLIEKSLWGDLLK